jgi:hypothetical protein
MEVQADEGMQVQADEGMQVQAGAPIAQPRDLLYEDAAAALEDAIKACLDAERASASAQALTLALGQAPAYEDLQRLRDVAHDRYENLCVGVLMSLRHTAPEPRAKRGRGSSRLLH